MPLLTKASRLGFAVLAPSLERAGISLADFRLVGVLLGETAGLSQRELAARLEVRPPTISAAVDKLVAAGLLERLASPTDARAVSVRLTPDAHGRGLGAALEHVQALEVRALRGFSAAEKKVLTALLERVVDNLGGAASSPSPRSPAARPSSPKGSS
jgi:DNA-binding MarR family transcriptional regulator